MEDDADLNLVNDHFDDVSIEDEPINDNESFFDERDYLGCEEEEVETTSENFRAGSRYKPSLHTLRELPTISEEKHDDIRSNASSRGGNTRPQSVMSDKSNDISNQFGFQSGGNAIEQFTDQFYSEGNRAERLFPEGELVNKGFVSPARDKQHSWEPSVCHYEKQPTPEVQNNSPGPIFANLSSRKEQPTIQPQQNPGTSRNEKNLSEKINDENAPMSVRTSPEKNIFATSPMNSTKFLETKTSTPKRPGGTNRLGQRVPPLLEFSTIYELSPQRSSSTSRLFQSRYPANGMTPNTATTTNSDTMLSNRTISDSMVQKVISGNKFDNDLLAALESVRKKREQQPLKPDFRLNTTQTRVAPKTSVAQRSSFDNHGSLSGVPTISTTSTTATTSSYGQSSQQKLLEGQRNSVMADMTNSNTTSLTSNISRLSTAKTDLSRSSRQRGGFSDSSVSTMIPNVSSTTALSRDREGRDSVNSMRTISRASSTMTVGGSHVNSASGALKPLNIRARRLAFGVVPVDETLTMELEIENVSDRQCQVRSSVDSNTNVYKILDNKLTMVDPRRSIKLRVSFTPCSIGRYQVLLNIEVTAQNFVQKIPIWGIGGVAKIIPVSAQDLQPTANPSEFAMYSSNIKRISFKLSNSAGNRDGFALMTVYDSSMRQLPEDCVSFQPACGVVIGRKSEKRVEIRIDTSSIDHHDDDLLRRSSSAMSTASAASSIASSRRRAVPGADFVVQIAWGEEVLRQRLRMLASRTGRRQSIDGHDFSSHHFADEETLRPPPRGFPHIVPDDCILFASSYRTLYINIFSSPRGLAAFRAATVHSLDSGTCNDVTVLETTAFRHQTFVNDVTMLPTARPTKRT